MKSSYYLTFTLWMSLMCVGFTISAQEKESLHPLQPSDTSSPRATLTSFINSCNELYDLANSKKKNADSRSTFLPVAERIMDCLNLEEIPIELRDSVGVESAVFLKEVLDRIELPPINKIPDETTIKSSKNEESFTRWQIPNTRLEIVQIQKGARRGQYLFSIQTIRQATKFYSAVKQLSYRKKGLKTSPGLYELYQSLTNRQPTLSLDTSSPRGTITLFFNSANELFNIIHKEKSIDRTDPKYLPLITKIYSCLDLSDLPDYSRDYYAGEAAVCLKEILDRVNLPPVEKIPGSENMNTGSDNKILLRWQIPKTQLTIARIEEGPRRGEYLFTKGTVKRAVGMYEKIKKQPYQTEGRKVSKGFHDWWLTAPGNPSVASLVDKLPHWFRDRIFSLAIWQWIGLLTALIMSLCIIFLVYKIGRTRTQNLIKESLLRYWVLLLVPIVAMLVPLLFKHIVFEYLTIRGHALYLTNFCADIVFLLALISVIVGISNRISESIIALPNIRSQGLDAHLIRILCRILGIGAAIIVFLEGGRHLGFPLSTLLASAGIGGLAIALAAQGMIKGLFGTVTILLDKPFRVGERIIVKGQDGIVEEIGLHSTKIRTLLSNHLVSIPNDQMADSEIENVGRRQHIRRTLDLHIPLDTPKENVLKAVSILRSQLDNHEGMVPELPPRVYFDEFNSDSFNIKVIYWYHPPDIWKFYAFSEKLNFEIFSAFEDNGIQFSLPFRHTYWKEDDKQGPLEVNMIDKF